MKWANGNTELDRLKRFCIAYEFVQAEKIRESALSDVKQIRGKIVELDESTEKLNTEINEMDKNIATLAAEKEAKLGGEMKVLSEKVDKIQHALIKETSLMNNEEETLRSEENAAEKVIYCSYSSQSISNPHLFRNICSLTDTLFAYRFSRTLRTSRDL